MLSPSCKTLHRRAESPSSIQSFHFDVPLQKVQRAVLFSLFVEATLRNVSLLTFVRRRNGPAREEAPAAHPETICAEVENRKFHHAEERTSKTWRVQGEDAITCARRTHLNTRFRYVSRLTWCIDPRRPRVQRLNISRGSNALVQDRCAGDNV